jgi:hypothetical protein
MLPPVLAPPLHERPHVLAEMDAARDKVGRLPTSLEMSLLLVCSVDGQYQVMAKRGRLEDEFKEGTRWTRTEVLNGGAFTNLAEQFDYTPTVVHFDAGDMGYMLLALATAPLPELGVLIVDETATALLLGACDGLNPYLTGGK